MNTNNQSSKPLSWFNPGWRGIHSKVVFGTSVKLFWVAPLIFATYFLLDSYSYNDEFMAAFLVSSVVALLVSFLFSLLIYPLLQLAYASTGILQSSSNGSKLAWTLLPLQQLLIWAIGIGTVLTDFRPAFSCENELIQFSSLVAFHAAIHLFVYSRRMWSENQLQINAQNSTLEHELATADIERNIEGAPGGRSGLLVN